jgi:hypothetical protein
MIALADNYDLAGKKKSPYGLLLSVFSRSEWVI